MGRNSYRCCCDDRKKNDRDAKSIIMMLKLLLVENGESLQYYKFDELSSKKLSVSIVTGTSQDNTDTRIIRVRKCDVKKEVSDVIERLKKKDKDFKVKVKIISQEWPAVCDTANPLFKEFGASIKRVLGRRGRHALLAGATDMRFLIRRGVACLGYSPDGGNSCHCDNENVKIKSLLDTTKILADVISNIR